MATQDNVHLITLEAGSDLSAHQFKFLTVAADGQCDLSGDGDASVGVLQNKPAAAGRAALVAIGGIVKVECGAVVTRGGNVASGASGTAINAALADNILGTALDTGAAGRIIRMVFSPRDVSA